MTLFTNECRFYLARQTGPMALELVDGCHSSTEGVAKAAVLHSRIFADSGPWLMVELHEAPSVGAVAVNEEAAEACRALVEGENPDG